MGISLAQKPTFGQISVFAFLKNAHTNCCNLRNCLRFSRKRIRKNLQKCLTFSPLKPLPPLVHTHRATFKVNSAENSCITTKCRNKNDFPQKCFNRKPLNTQTHMCEYSTHNCNKLKAQICDQLGGHPSHLPYNVVCIEEKYSRYFYCTYCMYCMKSIHWLLTWLFLFMYTSTIKGKSFLGNWKRCKNLGKIIRFSHEKLRKCIFNKRGQKMGDAQSGNFYFESQ